MRASEILHESVQEDLANDLQDLLINYKGKGKSVIRTSVVVNQLQMMGYSVSAESLLSAINTMPMVVSADETNITFTTPGSSSPGTSDINQQNSADAVKKMAQDAASQ